jgi:hypothetical protein
MSRMKPMSSMRSAYPAPGSRRGSSSPCLGPYGPEMAGRGDEDVDATLECAICGWMPTPPKMTVDESFAACHAHRFPTCAASSRVGAGSARVWPWALPRGAVDVAGAAASEAQPAVLPVPVCAPASRSPPDTAGIACVCTGVGWV